MQTYNAQQNDTLYSIAANFGISVQALVTANPHLASFQNNPLPVGIQVVIPFGSGTGAQQPASPEHIQDRLQNGGILLFNVMTAAGPAEVPVLLGAPMWQALLASPLATNYGLTSAQPFIQVGTSQTFLQQARSILPANLQEVWDQTVAAPLSYFEEVMPGTNPNLPPVTNEMALSGIMWAMDPVTGEMQLIDTKPLFGPPVSAWSFVPTNPQDPSAGGTWNVVPDLATEQRSLFEGVPTSVEPWLQAALDAGGDISVVPEGPARAWVEYLLSQSVRSSSRPPTELPFGIGLPNFSGTKPDGTTAPGGSVPGFEGPEFQPWWSGTPQNPATGGSPQQVPTTPSGGGGSSNPIPTANNLPNYTQPNVTATPLGSQQIYSHSGAPVVGTNYGAPNAALSRLTTEQFDQVPDWVKQQTGATYSGTPYPYAGSTVSTPNTQGSTVSVPNTQGALSALSPEQMSQVPDWVKQATQPTVSPASSGPSAGGYKFAPHVSPEQQAELTIYLNANPHMIGQIRAMGFLL